MGGAISQKERLKRLPRNEFERMVAIEFPQHTGLARRLMDGSLNSEEETLLSRAKTVLAMRAEGKSQLAVATAIGLKPAGYAALAQRANFRVVCRWLREREIATDPKTREDGLKGERQRFDRMGALSLDYVESCFAKDAKTGEYLAPKRAEWAASLIAKGKGWDEPERQLGIIGELNVTLVMAKGADIRASDVLRAQARLATLDVTPPVALEPPAATAGIADIFDPPDEDDPADPAYESDFLPERTATGPPPALAEPLAAPAPEGGEGNE